MGGGLDREFTAVGKDCSHGSVGILLKPVRLFVTCHHQNMMC